MQISFRKIPVTYSYELAFLSWWLKAHLVMELSPLLTSCYQWPQSDHLAGNDSYSNGCVNKAS